MKSNINIGDLVEVTRPYPGLPLGSRHLVYDIYENRFGDTYASLSKDGRENMQGWDIDRFVKYEEKEKNVKVEMGKKYRMIGTHEPVRIICVDAVGCSPVIYLQENSQCSTVGFSDETGCHFGKRIIEEVPEVDWSKVEVDTLIWVDGIPHYFADSSEYFIYFFSDGRTSKTNTHPKTLAHKSACSLQEPK